MNTKNKKTLGFPVPIDYKFKGKEVRNEIITFFNWLNKNGGKDLIKSYPEYNKIKEILSW